MFLFNELFYFFVWPQVESFEYLRMSIDDVLRLDEDIESQDYPGNTSTVNILCGYKFSKILGLKIAIFGLAF